MKNKTMATIGMLFFFIAILNFSFCIFYSILFSLISRSKPTIPPFIPTPTHLTAIIYTSGTTGNPKGVELSHKNIVSNLRSLKEIWPAEVLKARRHTLSFIPWSHIFGMVASLHGLVGHGSCTSVVPKREQIMECLQLVKPTQMSAVPLMLNRVSIIFII